MKPFIVILFVSCLLFAFFGYFHVNKSIEKDDITQILTWTEEGYDIKTQVDKALEDEVINEFEYNDIKEEVTRQETIKLKKQ